MISMLASKQTKSILAIILLFAVSLTHSAAGADQEKINTDLLEAAYANQYKRAVNAVSKGADINYRDKAGRTAISWSVANGNLKLTNYLVKHGADIQHRKNDKTTLLHLAVSPTISLPPLKPADKIAVTSMTQRYAMLDYLLQQQLDPKITDEFGALPIHHAAALKGDADQQIKLLTLLISRGSPINKKNKYGFTPVDLAENPQVKSFLASKLK